MTTRAKISNMSVAIKSSWPYSPSTRRVNLDVAILAIPQEIDNITTPSGSQYTDCRPVWCAVPKMRSLSSSLSLVIVPSTTSYLADLMDVNIV